MKSDSQSEGRIYCICVLGSEVEIVWMWCAAISENDFKPEAIYDISMWLTKRYPNRPIYITANGTPRNSQSTFVTNIVIPLK